LSRGLLDSMDRFGLRTSDDANDRGTNNRSNRPANDGTPAHGATGRAASAR
jgi:hypothetical protein